jgi:hypothetical protein
VVGVLVLFAVLGLCALALHESVKRWGEADRTFWDAVLAMGAAKVLSRSVALLGLTDLLQRITLSFAVYAFVLIIYLAAFAKVGLVRSMLLGLGLAAMVLIGAFIGAMLVGKSTP